MYAHKNLKITFGGELYNGSEIWSCGLTVGFEDKDFDFVYPEQIVDISGGVEAHIMEWFQSDMAAIHPAARMSWIKMAILDTNGKYAMDGDDYEYLNITDFPEIQGGLRTDNYPGFVAPQLSVALTMETDVVRGAGRFGRIYPPLTGTVSDRGRDETNVGKAIEFAKLIGKINAQFWDLKDLTPAGVIVASAVGGGKNSPVKRVKVGQVIDTQRKRRNAMPEYYHTEKVVNGLTGV